MTVWIELNKLKGMMYEEKISEEGINALTLLIDENGTAIKSNILQKNREEAVAELSIVNFKKTTPERHLPKKLSPEFSKKLEKFIGRNINVSLAPYLGISVNLNWIARECINFQSPVEAYIFDPSLNGEEVYTMCDKLEKENIHFKVHPSPLPFENKCFMVLNCFNSNITSLQSFYVDVGEDVLRKFGRERLFDSNRKKELLKGEDYHYVTGKRTVYKTKCGISKQDYATMAQVFIPPYDENSTVLI